MSNFQSRLIAFLILVFMIGVAYYSMRGDSAVMDEVAHLPAGYSYITQHDMRLNPEHPPLIKDLAGLSVLAWSKITDTAIKFPDNIRAWTQDINGQWDFGFDFMYKEGNPADSMLFFGRLPMLLLLLILGIYIFKWTKEIWGKGAALLALFLFAFSPAFIAHGRFVTTDVAAAAAVFISSYYFIHYLKKPNAWNLIWAGIIFGVGQLAKFSLFLLVPYFAFLTIAWIIIQIARQRSIFHGASALALKPAIWEVPKKPIDIKKESWSKIALRYIIGLVLIFLIGYGAIVTPVYYFHVKNYPVERQKADTEYILRSYASGPPEPGSPILSPCISPAKISRCPAQIAIWLASSNSLPGRAFGQYLLGLVMVVQRAAGGNTTYFLGEISNTGWKTYFPIIYLLKEPISLHILTLIALLAFVYYLFRKQKNYGAPLTTSSWFQRLFTWAGKNFEGLAMFGFIILYWVTSVNSKLNIGVRHVLPTFPLIFALVSAQIVSWARIRKDQRKVLSFAKYSAVGVLLTWQAISVMAVYPSFLAYFNESIGGPKNGYKYAVDSNLDWGQDLTRLKNWIDENNISKIYVDYFGGGDVSYYLGDKFQPWWDERSPLDLKSGDWLAVSATFLQGGRGKLAPGFKSPAGYYDWLNNLQPKSVIGYSIFVYQIP